MKKIIRTILKEDRGQMFLNNIVKYMKNDFPIIKNLKDYGFYDQLSEDEINYVLSGIFGKPVQRKIQSIYDNHNEIYYEHHDGTWVKYEYDENGNIIYSENYSGDWGKWEFDKNGNVIYFENSDGYWEKYEYNENGNVIYYENSDGEIRDKR